MHSSKRKCDFPPVPADKLPGLVGKRVHLAWAQAGANWVLKEILEDGSVRLVTPLTGKPLVAKASDVCYTNLHLGHAKEDLACEARLANRAREKAANKLVHAWQQENPGFKFVTITSKHYLGEGYDELLYLEDVNGLGRIFFVENTSQAEDVIKVLLKGASQRAITVQRDS